MLLLLAFSTLEMTRILNLSHGYSLIAYGIGRAASQQILTEGSYRVPPLNEQAPESTDSNWNHVLQIAERIVDQSGMNPSSYQIAFNPTLKEVTVSVCGQFVPMSVPSWLAQSMELCGRFKAPYLLESEIGATARDGGGSSGGETSWDALIGEDADGSR